MGLIKEIILENSIRIIPKPDYVSYSDIQECLSKAHAVNEKNGLIYATQNQTVNTLILIRRFEVKSRGLEVLVSDSVEENVPIRSKHPTPI